MAWLFVTDSHDKREMREPDRLARTYMSKKPAAHIAEINQITENICRQVTHIAACGKNR